MKVELDQREKDLQEREARNDDERRILALGVNMVKTHKFFLLSLASLSLDGCTDVYFPLFSPTYRMKEPPWRRSMKMRAS